MKRVKTDPNSYSFEEHVREVRQRLIFTAVVFILSLLIAYWYAPQIMNYLLQAGKQAGYSFTYISPQEILVQQLRVTGILAILITLPLSLYECIRFVSPALPNKKVFLKTITALCASVLSMLSGLLFAYKILLPFVLAYLENTGKEIGLAANITVEGYMSLIIEISCVLGLLFEIPLIFLILTSMGIVNSNILRKSGRVATILIFTLAAIITPPDVFSQCLVALPLVALYYISVLICFIVECIGRYRKCRLQ